MTQLSDIKWTELRLGQKVISVLGHTGKIIGLVEGNVNVFLTRDCDGEYVNSIIIQWDNEGNTISVIPHWLSAHISVEDK